MTWEKHTLTLQHCAEAHTKLMKDNSWTSWLSQTMQSVRYAPISEIDFSALTTKLQKI